MYFGTGYVYGYADWSSYSTWWGFDFISLQLVCQIWGMWDLNILSISCYSYANWSLSYLLRYGPTLGMGVCDMTFCILSRLVRLEEIKK